MQRAVRALDRQTLPDPRNFHRKVTGAPGFVEATGDTSNADGGRPAQLYRRGPLPYLNPPLTRPSS